MPISVREIARIAGVSASTVSRVLRDRNTNAASKEVRDRIVGIADELGYTPQRRGRAAQTGAESATDSRFFCLIARPAEVARDDQFFSQIIMGIEGEAIRQSRALEYVFQLVDVENGIMDRICCDIPHKALIVLGRFERGLLDMLTKRFDPLIYVGLNDLGIDHDQVVCDGGMAAEAAVKYLYGLGHRRIGFIGDAGEMRYEGYRRGMEACGLIASRQIVAADAKISMEGGQLAMQTILAAGGRPTAVFCANDRAAIGAMKACKDFQLRIPEDVSFVGMNDIEVSRYANPALTSISVPLEEMGRIAVRVLSDRIRGQHSLPLYVRLPFRITERESCIRCPVATDAGEN